MPGMAPMPDNAALPSTGMVPQDTSNSPALPEQQHSETLPTVPSAQDTSTAAGGGAGATASTSTNAAGGIVGTTANANAQPSPLSSFMGSAGLSAAARGTLADTPTQGSLGFASLLDTATLQALLYRPLDALQHALDRSASSGLTEIPPGAGEALQPLQLCAPADFMRDLCSMTWIGRGSHGVVFKGTWRGAVVGIKFSASHCGPAVPSSAILREALVSKALSHPNVLQTYATRCCQLGDELLVRGDPGAGCGASGALLLTPRWLQQQQEPAGPDPLSTSSTADAGLPSSLQLGQAPVASCAAPATAPGGVQGGSEQQQQQLAGPAGVEVVQVQADASGASAAGGMESPVLGESAPCLAPAAAAAASVVGGLLQQHKQQYDWHSNSELPASLEQQHQQRQGQGMPQMLAGTAGGPSMTHMAASATAAEDGAAASGSKAKPLAEIAKQVPPAPDGDQGAAASAVSMMDEAAAEAVAGRQRAAVAAAAASATAAARPESSVADLPSLALMLHLVQRSSTEVADQRQQQQHLGAQQQQERQERQLQEQERQQPLLLLQEAQQQQQLLSAQHGSASQQQMQQMLMSHQHERQERRQQEQDCQELLQQRPQRLMVAAAAVSDYEQMLLELQAAAHGTSWQALEAAMTSGRMASFNSEEGFGNPYGDHFAGRSLGLGHVLMALGALPGQYVSANIMEFADKNTLHHVIHRHVFKAGKFWARRVAVRALLRTACEVAAGMEHLHSRHVVHGDLTSANVLLCTCNMDRRGFSAKVSDFGLSRFCGTGDSVSARMSGTLCYTSPEQLAGSLSKASDVYSFGVLLYEMSTASLPYEGMDAGVVMEQVQGGLLRPMWPLAGGSDAGLCILPEVQLLCSRCWRHNPEERPSFDSIAEELRRIEAEVRRAARRSQQQQPQKQR